MKSTFIKTEAVIHYLPESNCSKINLDKYKTVHICQIQCSSTTDFKVKGCSRYQGFHLAVNSHEAVAQLQGRTVPGNSQCLHRRQSMPRKDNSQHIFKMHLFFKLHESWMQLLFT